MRTWLQWSCALLLGLVAATAVAAEPFAEMLEQAESVRSTDPARFKVLLGELNANIQQATAAQRGQLEYLKAYELAYTGRFDLAIRLAKVQFEQAADVGLRVRAGALIVNSYAATREFTEGLRYLNLTLDMIGDIQDRDLRHHALSVAAILHNQLGQYELGESYAQQILADKPSERNRCYAAHFLLEARLNLGTLPDNDAVINSAIDDCARLGEAVGANQARMHLARRWASQGKRTAAIALLEQHLPEIEQTGYPRLIGEVHSLLAELQLGNGNMPAARKHAKIAVANSVGVGHTLPLVTAYRVLYEVALDAGDTASALVNYRNYADADKAYLDDVKAREMAVQLVRHETQQKTQTIELLNKQNEVLRLGQQVAAKTTQANQLLIALLAVMLASIGYWAYKIKRMQVSFRRLAETDALTGISNRHHFTRRAMVALEYCRKSGEDAGLVMLDLDNFKAINDQFGHATGDWALIRVAEVCGRICRKNDLVGRLGGEEFAFLLVGCDIEASATLAQQCRAAIAAIDTGSTGHQFPITASFGVAGSRDCGHAFEALLARADDALYRSKREGRDRVSMHDPAADAGATA